VYFSDENHVRVVWSPDIRCAFKHSVSTEIDKKPTCVVTGILAGTQTHSMSSVWMKSSCVFLF